MDYRSLYCKIRQVKEKVDAIDISFLDKKYRSYLDDLRHLLDIMGDFICKDDNVSILIECQNNKRDDQEFSPLGNLCNDVVIKLEQLENEIDSTIDEFQKGNQNYYQILNGVGNVLQQFVQTKLLDVFEILKHLSEHDKTLIILGPNGSGKTSFANYLRNADSHVKVIPASKPIRNRGNVPHMYNSTINSFNNEIYANNDLNEELLQKLVIGLCTENDNIAREYYNTGKRMESNYTKIKRIFDSFFDVKLDDSMIANKQIQAAKTGHTPFPFNSMSDGERAAFFYIATVIVAPKQSFIIVDEPENHLNPAVYNKIWDRLIEVRSDCQFIFISHTLEFINARFNYELVTIKSFTYPDKFELEFFGDGLDNVNKDFIVEIMGSRRPILFCEGTKNDYDYKIYEVLFGEQYTIIPVGNCISVIESVEACNRLSIMHSIQSAIGIIDSDLKSDDEIARMKEKNVFVLRCNEIEMFLIDKTLFKAVLKHMFKEETDFDLFTDAFFDIFGNRKDAIIKRLVKTQIDETLHNTFIDDRNNKTREEIKANYNAIISSIDVDGLWDECDKKISEIISKKDYDAALKYCCLGHNEILVGVCNRFVNGYANLALGVLKEDKGVSIELRKKYFPGFG